MVGVRGGTAAGVVIIQVAADDETLIQAVIALGNRNTRTLGLLVPAAYRQAAEADTLLAALDGETVVGYALYGLPRQHVRLTHLCVAVSHRKHGIARALIDEITLRHRDRTGISAKCRRDYNLARAWRSLGFERKGEKSGRGKDRHPLDVWWLDHGHPDLFSAAEPTASVRVVVDFEVFADLHADGVRPGREESRALLAQWLTGSLELVATPQLFREISRIEKGDEQNRQRRIAERYPQAQVNPISADDLAETITKAVRERSGADQVGKTLTEGLARHIAEAASDDVRYLVSRDEQVLKLSDITVDVCGVRIITPSEATLQIDDLLHAQIYQPASLLNTSLSIESLRTEPDAEVVGFIATHRGEKRSTFDRLLRSLPDTSGISERCLVRGPAGQVLAIYAQYLDGTVMRVPLLRTARHSLEPTLARQLLFMLRQQCRRLGGRALLLSDAHMPETMIQAALEDRFSHAQGGLATLVVDACGTAAEIHAVAASAAADIGWNGPEVPSLHTRMGAHIAAGVEQAWWPAKVCDSLLPSFVVPIQPRWASLLFDAPASLVPRDDQLGISREHVYYRRPNPRGHTAPARLLWYMSAGGHQQGMVAIGCSRLDEVLRQPAETTFARFRYLGAYGRDDVLNAAPSGIVEALRFSDTEMFTRQVPLRRLKAIAADLSQSWPVQSLTKISSELFQAVYREGQPARE